MFFSNQIKSIAYTIIGMFFSINATAFCGIHGANYRCSFYGIIDGSIPNGESPPPASASAYFFWIFDETRKKNGSEQKVFDSRSGGGYPNNRTDVQTVYSYSDIRTYHPNLLKVEGKALSGATMSLFYVTFRRELYSTDYDKDSIYIFFDPWATTGYGNWTIASSSSVPAHYEILEGIGQSVKYDLNIVQKISWNPF